MKALVPLVVCGSLLLPACRQSEGSGGEGDEKPPADEAVAATVLDPEAGGIRIDPSSGLLGEIDSLLVTFPTEMVTGDMLNRVDVKPPLKVQPPVEGSWFQWISPTSGRLIVNRWEASSPVTRTVRLLDGLVDLEGKPVGAEDWGAEFSHEEFGVAGVSFLDFGDSAEEPAMDHDLAANQLVQIVLTRDVAPQEIARKVRFVDVESREEYPVRVALMQHQPETPQGEVLVEPENPLPGGREMRLVIDRLESGRRDLRLPSLVRAWELMP